MRHNDLENLGGWFLVESNGELERFIGLDPVVDLSRIWVKHEALFAALAYLDIHDIRVSLEIARNHQFQSVVGCELLRWRYRRAA